MAQKQTNNTAQQNSSDDLQARPFTPQDLVNAKAIRPKIDRVLEILHSLPMLRRYGDDAAALKEALEILEDVKEKMTT